MGKGERRGGGRRAGGRRIGRHHRAGHRHHIGLRAHHHHRPARRIGFRSRGVRGGGGGTIHLGPAAGKTVIGICMGFFGVFLIGVGIMLTAIFATSGTGSVAAGACVLVIGVALLGVSLWLCNKQWKEDQAAASAQGQGQPGVHVISDATGTVTTTTVNQDGQAVINMTTVPNQPGVSFPTDWSNMAAGQPYPGSQPYPGTSAAGGFAAAPSAPPSAQPPQYGFTYNTSDNYNTQYSSGTSDLPPPPAYSTVVNEKL
ncbi:PREDICTED: uncharacterized protein LOC109484470 isoform X2 [Branchiostoma belcheri]|uniref:Uncharacterized protein LOC109484470 isoform X2 n=1 Tax=Branchiostoma belcheri TaxID=7741 RepID=A0A6P5A1W3_BRABE|nr:PREDICTED: uncharacterized protein LOC109484470 isoform X2 [Branchiostoma belcheri]